MAFIDMAAGNGLLLLTNQYEPNPSLTGDITITGVSTFLGASGINGSPTIPIFGADPGVIYIDARNDVQIIDSVIQNSGRGTVGDVVINAAETIQLEQVARPTGIAANLNIGQMGTGGDIRLTANTLNVLNGAQLQTGTLGNGDAGDIIINVSDRVLFDQGTAISAVAVGGTGQGGDIRIDANTVELLNSSQLLGNTFGTGHAGNVIVNGRDQVRLDNTSQASSRVSFGAAGMGGNVEIVANTLEVTNGSQLLADTNGVGDAGNVIVNVTDSVALRGRSLDGQFVPFVSSQVNLNGIGNGGNVEITANTVELDNGGQFVAATQGRGAAGDVVINARDSVRLDNTSTNLRNRSGAFSTVEATAVGNGGSVLVTTDTLTARNGAQLQTSTRGEGNAGNVRIEATDTVLFEGTSIDSQIPSAALSEVDAGGMGNGGDIEITANNLTVGNGANISARTANSGDAGDVHINTAGAVLLDGTSPDGQSPSATLSEVAEGAMGDGGNIEVNAGSLAVRNGANLSARTAGNGSAGDVRINTAGAVLLEGTSADGQSPSATLSEVGDSAVGNGGNVEIAARSLTVRNGANISAQTAGNGNAGNLIISVAEAVSLQGTDAAGRPTTIAAGSEVTATGRGNDIRITAPDLQVLDGAVLEASTRNDQPGGDVVLDLGELALLREGQIATSSAGSGAAGTIQVDASDGIRVSADSRLSVQSQADGPAGNILIGLGKPTPTLQLEDRGQIIAESAAVDGGNITIALSDLLQLRNNSLISASAGTERAPGNGGNITISVPFIIAVPAENSDIAADAFEGTGGNVSITARGVFGIEPRPQRTPLSDITASSEIGISGTVIFDVLDTGFIENNLGDLSDDLVDTALLTAGSCIANADNGSQGSFIVTGGEGLPLQPGGQCCFGLCDGHSTKH
ncbi:MAG: S-layer family protein [Leptolyngbya sp. SIOISBB]|nr:S-layer family protein [Leptolyngbya sp. SIOISBB]